MKKGISAEVSVFFGAEALPQIIDPLISDFLIGHEFEMIVEFGFALWVEIDAVLFSS